MTRPLTILAVLAAAPAPTAEHLAFFGKKIRPVLAVQCYGCHFAPTHHRYDLPLIRRRPPDPAGVV
jgi:hypothetical protein